MALERPHRHSFVLRLWREADSPEWKGWVQHANSGASARIDSFADLLAFIERFKDKETVPRMDAMRDDHHPARSKLK